MLKKLLMLTAAMMLLVISGASQAQPTKACGSVIGKEFKLISYNKNKYTGQVPITLSFNEIGNPNFFICGRNIVTAAPDCGIIYHPNSAFASSNSSSCQDKQSKEILDSYYTILANGGSGATDKGETFYILIGKGKALSFNRVK